MNIKNCLAILAGSVLVLASSGRSNAQSQCSCDGIAASPRLRQMMDDRAAMLPPMGAGEYVADEDMRASTTVAPPRIREQLIEQDQHFTSAPPVVYEQRNVGYKATGPDGITASPRVRQMLEDQPIGVDLYEVR